MKRPNKRDELFLTRHFQRELRRRIVALGARVHKDKRGIGNSRIGELAAQKLRQLQLGRVAHGVRRMQHLRRLRLDRRHDTRVAVAAGMHRDPPGEVHKLPPGECRDTTALGLTSDFVGLKPENIGQKPGLI